mmetsp:Transcript_21253/g.75574  ORF Transcript_21253/g.75574 Transcript_21253/m.75574 type:complete len:200 (-) Transcript_21253:35-634(-)
MVAAPRGAVRRAAQRRRWRRRRKPVLQKGRDAGHVRAHASAAAKSVSADAAGDAAGARAHLGLARGAGARGACAVLCGGAARTRVPAGPRARGAAVAGGLPVALLTVGRGGLAAGSLRSIHRRPPDAARARVPRRLDAVELWRDGRAGRLIAGAPGTADDGPFGAHGSAARGRPHLAASTAERRAQPSVYIPRHGGRAF